MLMIQVSITEASYDFIAHFYEFRNSFGLQYHVCDVGGPPTCYDDAQPNLEACTNSQPCVTGFCVLAETI